MSPLSYTRAAPSGVGGVGGEGTYWVPVSSTHQAVQPNDLLQLHISRFMKRSPVCVGWQFRTIIFIFFFQTMHQFWFCGSLTLEVSLSPFSMLLGDLVHPVFPDRWPVTGFRFSSTSWLGWRVCRRMDSERIYHHGGSLGLRSESKRRGACFCSYPPVGNPLLRP